MSSSGPDRLRRALLLALALIASGSASAGPLDSLVAEPGVHLARFENLEGLVLVPVRLYRRVPGAPGAPDPPEAASASASDRPDTLGPMVLDTGAGFPAVDRGLARWLGIADSIAHDEPLSLAARPLPRLELAGAERDQLEPVIVVDAGIVRRASGRPVMGLLGESVFRGHGLALDYESGQLALLSPEAIDRLTRPMAPPPEPQDDAAQHGPQDSSARQPRADRAPGAQANYPISLSFSLLGDGKIVVSVRMRGDDDDSPDRSRADRDRSATGEAADSAARPRMKPRIDPDHDLARPGGERIAAPDAADPGELRLVLDTGATTTVLFPSGARRLGAVARRWPTIAGLSAPTLTGSERASLMLVPEVELTGAPGGWSALARHVEVARIGGPLEAALSQSVGAVVHGLLGYSFLRSFHVLIDYPRRMLWLAPLSVPAGVRPYEGVQPGIQLERVDGAVRVSAVFEGSPAERAGIRVGQTLVSVDGARADTLDLIAIGHRLEGAPGTTTRLVLHDGRSTRTRVVARRRLLEP